MAPAQVVHVIALFVGLCNSAYLPIDIRTKNCGSHFHIADENEYIIKGTGDFTGTSCSYTFTGEIKDNCDGLCYDMSNGSFINNNETTLTLTTETQIKVFTYQNLTIGPWCSEETNVSVILEVPDHYEFDSQHPGYEFTMAIYNKCGDDKTMTFEEAIKHLDGYQHGQEFEDKEHQTTVYGIIVGACLAAMFLVLFAITVCYYRQHADKKTSRSASFGIPEADHHIRLKNKRRSEVRRASKVPAEEKRASQEHKKPVRPQEIQMMKF